MKNGQSQKEILDLIHLLTTQLDQGCMLILMIVLVVCSARELALLIVLKLTPSNLQKVMNRFGTVDVKLSQYVGLSSTKETYQLVVIMGEEKTAIRDLKKLKSVYKRAQEKKRELPLSVLMVGVILVTCAIYAVFAIFVAP